MARSTCSASAQVALVAEHRLGREGALQPAMGNMAEIVYEARTNDGKTFRNCEVHTVRDGMLTATEVYFGSDLPHKAPAGGFIKN